MNHKIIEIKTENTENIITMSEMEPGQVGVIVDDAYNGHYVLRTYAINHFEVMDLNIANRCWATELCPLKVRLLNPDESVIVEFKN